MASDDEEEDDGTGQVCRHQIKIETSTIGMLVKSFFVCQLHRHSMLVDRIHRVSKFWDRHAIKTAKISCQISLNRLKKVALKLSKIHIQAVPVVVASEYLRTTKKNTFSYLLQS